VPFGLEHIAVKRQDGVVVIVQKQGFEPVGIGVHVFAGDLRNDSLQSCKRPFVFNDPVNAELAQNVFFHDGSPFSHVVASRALVSAE
jgi:hypothetical protein